MMSCSQIFSSFLCIGFLFSIVNGFLVIFQPKVLIPHRGSSCGPPSTAADRRFRNLHAIKGKSKASTTAIGSTSSDKVKEMASFLSVQLLQKIMTEAMKPEGESTMKLDGEAVERLTEALQMGSQPSSETTTSEATGDSDEADDAALDRVEIPTTTADATTEPTLSTPTGTTETKSDDAPLSSTTTTTNTEDDDTTSTSSNPTEIQSSETMLTEKAKEEDKVVIPPVAEKVSPPVVRKPLEVVQSDIPPLRPESIPQKTDDIAEEEEKEAEIVPPTTVGILEEEVVVEEETIAVISEDAEKEECASEEIVDASPSIVDEKAEELFRRRLLQQKFEFDKKEATRIENEQDADLNDDEKQVDDTACSPPEDVASDQETETVDAASVSMERKKAEKSFRRRLLQQKFEFDKKEAATRLKEETEEEEEEENHQGESSTISSGDNIISEPARDVVEPESPNLTAAERSPSPIISERRVETIVALRQPKSSDEESKLAEKYANMENLEDRAYALLCDLGMIEEHKDPRDSSYDHSKDDDEYCGQRFLPLL
jgi:hypothetical protein